MNYYERHLGDYAKDTAHLTMLEHGAYNLLLDRYYGTESGIPESQAHRVARARTKEEKQAVDDVLAEFFSLVDGMWINKRADEEITKAQGKITAAKENGKKGGRPRRVESGSENETQQKPSGLSLGSENETKQKPSGLSLGSENKTQQKAHQTPDTRHQVNLTPKSSPIPETELRPDASAVAIAGAAVPEVPTAEGQWLSWFNREAGTNYDPASRFDRSGVWPVFARWVKAGVSQQQVRDALQTAQQSATKPIACLPKYLDRVLANSQAPQRQAAQRTSVAAEREAASIALTGRKPTAPGRIASPERDITGECSRVA